MTAPGDVLPELERRGLLVQYSEKGDLGAHLQAPRTLYCGFDPTADSLHVGSLAPLFTLLRFALCGHRPILLLGGGTGLIGDPSFKEDERALQPVEQVAEQCEAIRRQCRQILENFQASGPKGAADCELQFRDNLDWLGGLNLVEFLRDIGKFFPVNAMVQKESVRRRLEDPQGGISFTEFSYMLLQAYDFLELYRHCGCTIQIGGSDQWGNITQGIELVRRWVSRTDGEQGEQAYGATLPLLTRADGGKFGKTERGTVWLQAERTSPYAFYQFWINVADQDLGQYENFFSFREVGISGPGGAGEADAAGGGEDQESGEAGAAGGGKNQQVAGGGENQEAGDAGDLRRRKQDLAFEITSLVHGGEEAQRAQRISRALFSGDISELGEEELRQLALDGLDKTVIAEEEIGLAQVLVQTGLARNPRGQGSLKQAREFLRSGAVQVNGRVLQAEDAVLRRGEALFGGWHLLRRGKKQFHLLCWKGPGHG